MRITVNPGNTLVKVYDTITPVNTIRIAINRACGTNFPMLPDRNYIFPDMQHLYGFIDISDLYAAGRAHRCRRDDAPLEISALSWRARNQQAIFFRESRSRRELLSRV